MPTWTSLVYSVKDLRDAFKRQPASFEKKKNYEYRRIVGKGTFGKVMVGTTIVSVIINQCVNVNTNIVVVIIARDMVRSKPQLLKSLRKARGAIHPPTQHKDGDGETRRRAQNNQEIHAQETR